MTNCTLFTNHWEVCQQHWDVRLLLATGAWKFGEFTKYDHRLVDDLFVPRDFELYDIYIIPIAFIVLKCDIYIHHILHTYIYIWESSYVHFFVSRLHTMRMLLCYNYFVLYSQNMLSHIK